MRLKIEELFREGNVTGVSFDSRNVKSGDAFFAITGDSFDGNEYIDDALSRGASFVFTDNPSKKGKNINEIDAFNYISKVGLGIDFTARDIQSHNKKNGLPWGFSKSFDGSAAISKLINANRINDFNNINFLLKKNNVLAQEGNSNLMIYKIDFLISYISNFITLEKGDLIFSGTPKGVSKINIGDKLDGYHENEKILSINIS